jgi:O-antigen biosynthesis protein
MPKGLPNTELAWTASEKASIFVVDAMLPQYDRDAGGRSCFLYLQALRELGHAVFFMPNDQLRREPYATVLQRMGVHLLIGKAYRCGRWKNWLSEQRGRITHVILHRPNVSMRYLPAIKKMRGMKILYFACDLRCLREARHYGIDGDMFHRREAAYWEKVERSIVEQVDIAYFFSQEEAQMVSSWNAANAHTLPLFPTDRAASLGLPYDQRNGLLFVGGFAHEPNPDAVIWFATEVLPLVRRLLPDVEWHIVGHQPTAGVRRLAGGRVFVEGAVSEARLEHLYRTTRLVLAPLRFGAGVKGKVVEAMCQGVPVITTPVGAEGIPAGGDVLSVSASAEDMATQLVDLYQSAAKWEAQRERALATVDKHFSRRAVQLRLSADLAPAQVRSLSSGA